MFKIFTGITTRSLKKALKRFEKQFVPDAPEAVVFVLNGWTTEEPMPAVTVNTDDAYYIGKSGRIWTRRQAEMHKTEFFESEAPNSILAAEMMDFGFIDAYNESNRFFKWFGQIEWIPCFTIEVENDKNKGMGV